MKYLFFLLISFSAFAGPFTAHVKESITINKARFSYYSSLTGGKSDGAIKKLIFIERIMLPYALKYDYRASFFQKKGVMLMQNEFLPMISSPEFDPERRTYPTNEISGIDWRKHQSELKAIIKNKNRDLLLKRSLEMINEYKNQPAYWCLTRHLVESVYRFAWFLPERIQEARIKNVRSPEKLIWEIIEFHLRGFSLFVQVDLKAAPVQKEGIPMLCMELPDLLSDLN